MHTNPVAVTTTGWAKVVNGCGLRLVDSKPSGQLSGPSSMSTSIAVRSGTSMSSISGRIRVSGISANADGMVANNDVVIAKMITAVTIFDVMSPIVRVYH